MENMLTVLCQNYLDLNGLSYGLLDLLDDSVLTAADPAVYGGAPNIALLRRIRAALTAVPWDPQTIAALTPDVNGAQGPLYFRLIKTMYHHWSTQRDHFHATGASYESADGSDGADGSSISDGPDGSDGSEHEDPMATHEFVRRTGVRRLRPAGMQALLSEFKNVYR